MNMSSIIDYEHFSKVSMMVGTIQSAEDIPKADKLYKLMVDLGPAIGVRQILAGIKLSYEKSSLINKQIIVVVNLEPRKIRG